ncbi:hypothetical protein CHS0354_013045 [Potamilus streckersoni]|uniref:Uncharacterized protein n=1 Tax=Potamilus streckersoni TaxID=2493646 RepID=A0AAE0S022_9BIVA|nr:hypothetical protein CHS0354_013045 [Potamilus streckersoni]
MSNNENEKLINREDMPTGSYETTIRPIFAEFVGVCLFVFIGCMASQNELLTAVALAHGLTIALLIIGVGPLSGGHFNPAVTLGVTLAGAIKPVLALGYFVAQLLGGLLGAAFVRAVLPSSIYMTIKGGIHSLGTGVDPGWAIIGEVILTTVLVFTVLMSAVNSTTKSSLAPLAIGFAVAVDIMSGGPTTGASMNPARALGPAVVSYAVVSGSFNNHYVWWVGPLLGGLVAGLLYRVYVFSRIENKGEREREGVEEIWIMTTNLMDQFRHN